MSLQPPGVSTKIYPVVAKRSTTLDRHRGFWPLPWVTLSLAGAAVLAAISPQLAGLLEDRRVFAAEPWRPITGHLTHSSTSHLLLNLLLFLPLAALIERRQGSLAFLLEYLVLAGAVALGVPSSCPSPSVR